MSSGQLDHALNHLKRRLLDLCAVVETQVAHALSAVANRDPALAATVIAGDDAVDRAEVDIEEECLKTLALHQPVAGDLRTIVSFLKINNDLERIADLAVHIAERAVEMEPGSDGHELPFPFQEMSAKVKLMLKHTLDAVLDQDLALAQQVIHDDDLIDQIHRVTYNRIADQVATHPEHAHWLLNALSVSRYLERIADHATNIAEDAIYMLQGEIVRHRGTAAAVHPQPRATHGQ